MLNAWKAVWTVGVVLSVTVIVKFDVPVLVGVPLIAQLEVFRNNPVGRGPVTAKL